MWRTWLAFLVILIVYLRFTNGEGAVINDVPQAVTIDPELAEDLKCLKDAKAPVPENESTKSDGEVSGRPIDMSEEKEFDEFEEHILDTTGPLHTNNPFDDDDEDFHSTVYQKAVTTPDEILKAMRSLEKFGTYAEENDKIKQVVTPRMQELFKNINIYVARMVNLTSHPVDANKFLEKDGFERCVVPNMWIKYPEMRKNLLILIKQLLEVTPKTIKVIPIELLDQILRIFENDDNLVHKSLVNDILYMWLPGHPLAQGRVIQLTGLYPFYKNLKKLDTNVVYNMIDLFNTLIKEHMDFRKNKNLYSKEERKLYQKIGLIELISTRKNCYGLLTVFQDAFEYNSRNNNLLIPALELLKLVKPTCLKKYKGRKEPLEFFTRLQTYVLEKENRKYFNSFLADLDEIEAALNEYVEELKPKHIEL